VLAQEAPALAEEHGVAHRRADVGEPGARLRQEVDVHPQEVLADDVEPGLGQQVVDVGDPPVGRVLHRQHRELGPALAHRGDRALEGHARHALPARKRLGAGLVRIGAERPLEGDPAGPRLHRVRPLASKAAGPWQKAPRKGRPPARDAPDRLALGSAMRQERR
jgi:hypothetical protein